MRWRKVVKYAGVLLLVQFVLGIVEGFFSPVSATSPEFLLLGTAASFAGCGMVFAHLSAYQPVRPFAHAWAALFVQMALAALGELALKPWFGMAPPLLIALDWMVLVCALLAGTALGCTLRRFTSPTDA